MKNIKVFIMLIACVLSNAIVFSSEQETTTPAPQKTRRITRQARTNAARTKSNAIGTNRQITNRSRSARTTRPTRSRRPAQTNTVKSAVGDNAGILGYLSADQKERYNKLLPAFKAALALDVAYLENWKEAVINAGTPLVKVHKLLLNYCKQLILQRLKNAPKELEIKAEETANEIVAAMTSQATQILEDGTDKDIFNDLMKNVLTNEEKTAPSRPWLDAVMNKGIALVSSGEMSSKDVIQEVNKALSNRNNVIMSPDSKRRIVAVVEKSIQNHIDAAAERNTPAYMQREFDGLLMKLSQDNNWNNTTMRPSIAWQNDIVAAAKNLNLPIDVLEQQIGAQIFYVAIVKAQRFLTDVEKTNLMNFVTTLKQKIAQK